MLKKSMKRFLVLVLLLSFTFPRLALAEEVYRVLLLGTDRHGDYGTVSEDEKMGRADVILVLAVREGSPGIQLLNIERDYLVELPNGFGANKLGTASYFGGPIMLMDAVNSLFGLNINRYLQTDIESIVDIIDIIGGVDVEVSEEDLAEFEDSQFTEPIFHTGINHLNGVQSQTFLRFRRMGTTVVDDNRQRNGRQVRLLYAMLDNLSRQSLSGALEALTLISNLINTNLSMFDLLLLFHNAFQPVDFSDRINFMTTPNGEYLIKRKGMHQVIIVEDMQDERSRVLDFLLYK